MNVLGLISRVIGIETLRLTTGSQDPFGFSLSLSLSLGHYRLYNYFTASTNNHCPNLPTSANNHRPTATDPLQQPMPATKPTATHAHRHDPKSFFFWLKREPKSNQPKKQFCKL